MNTASDADLVAQCLAGNHAAFASIVERYRGLVTGVTYDGCRGDIGRSEDLAQEAFLVAWQKLSALENRASLASWLCGIARNVARVARRKSRREENWISLEIADTVAAPPPVPSDAALTREQQTLLWRTLETIPARYRQVMILYYRQQQTAADVAIALDLTEATVRKRLERGRKLLRQELVRFVEDSLRETTPDSMFTAAVVAALPGAAPTSLLAISGAGATKAGGWFAAAIAAIGPLFAVVGGVGALILEIRNARSPRERHFVVKAGLQMVFMIAAFIFVAVVTGAYFRPTLSGSDLLLLFSGEWAAFFALVAAFTIGMNRRRRVIEREDGLPSAIPSLSKRQKLLVPVIIVASTFSAEGWLASLALAAGDWLSVIAILAVSIVLCTYSIRRVRRSTRLSRANLLAFLTVVMALNAVMVNLRLADWLSVERGEPVELPTASMNVFLLVLWLGMCSSVLISRQRDVADQLR